MTRPRPGLARVAAASVLVAGLASCSALLDYDLSGNEVGAEAGGDALLADEAAPGDGGGRTDGTSSVDGGGGTDGASDSGLDAFVKLDCSTTVLCDGFEGRTDARAPHWNQVPLPAGNFRIATEAYAEGLQSVLFTSAATPAGVNTYLLLGGGSLDAGVVANDTLSARMSAYVWLDYNPAETGAGVRQVLGLRPSSVLAAEDELEYAGITLGGAGTTAPYAEIRTYTGASPSSPSGSQKIPLGVDLRGGFHHVVIEASFSTNAAKKGRLAVYVDGTKRGEVQSLTTWAQQTQRAFVAWIGAKAIEDTPALESRFDNIEVRTP